MRALSRIQVLLATYNGKDFLREQIESIMCQDYDNLDVLARDDGSSDGTQGILEEYAGRYPGRFRVLPSGSTNGGIVHNFLSLMKSSTAEYLCFSDQDDIWLADKVSKTKRKMDELERKWGAHTPLLVFTDLRVVDQNLDTLYPSFWSHMGIDPEWINNLGALLVRPTVTGCTALINHQMVELAVRMPQDAAHHDGWIGLLAAGMGKAAFLKEQTVLYRQHGRNAVGTGENQRPTSHENVLRRVRRQTEFHIERWCSNQKEAAAFLEVYGAELPVKRRKVLAAFRQCETSESLAVRVLTYLKYRFYSRSYFSKFAILFYLWNCRA